jgi:hypothetical protein
VFGLFWCEDGDGFWNLGLKGWFPFRPFNPSRVELLRVTFDYWLPSLMTRLASLGYLPSVV